MQNAKKLSFPFALKKLMIQNKIVSLDCYANPDQIIYIGFSVSQPLNSSSSKTIKGS